MPCALIVEDNPNDLVWIGEILHRLAFDVWSAGTVAQARSLLIERMLVNADRPFDIAFVDLQMVGSVGNGLDIVLMLRELALKVPVVISTGAVHSAVIDVLWGLHYFAMAPKPMTRETMIHILECHKIPYGKKNAK